MQNASCKNLDELKSIPVEKLFEAFDITKQQMNIKSMICSPVIDGELVIDDSYKLFVKKDYNFVPCLIGSTSEDIIPPIIQSMSQQWAVSQNNNSFCYMFNHQLPGDLNGAWHSSDLWDWFGTLDNCWRPMSDVDYELSNVMVRYLTNFVKNGNPNEDGLPIWDRACKKNKKVMHFSGEKVVMKKVDNKKLWHNLFTNKAVGE